MNTQEHTRQTISAQATDVRLIALAGVPLVKAGDDLAHIIVTALAASRDTLRDGDVLVLAQKIVSKAQGRGIKLSGVDPSPEARELANAVNKDPRVVELVLRESSEVVRHHRDVLIVAHRLGFVAANAGIDMSNVEHETGDDVALLLPEDPDGTCRDLRTKLKALTGADIGIVINDSHGRAFRNGIVGVAIGVSGIPALVDCRGAPDLFGRRLSSTDVALADEIAAAASLLMGQGDEGRPLVIARGIAMARRDGSAAELMRPKQRDLFRQPAGEALLRGRRSIRRYLPQPVPRESLDAILETATYAPSAHNRQPWRFALVQEDATKERLARAMGERLRADRLRDSDAAEIVEADVARSFSRITSAPALVIVCLTMEDMDKYPDARRSAAEHQMAVQSTAIAMQTLLLAAHNAGLGASTMCGPLFCPDTVVSALGLPAHWEPQALVTLGYPAARGKPFRRRPLDDVVRVVSEQS
jgi:coenzyme F420-0:L-glutamate ligase/coenzyme F420-1:gamma-L-glutamate ligase